MPDGTLARTHSGVSWLK